MSLGKNILVSCSAGIIAVFFLSVPAFAHVIVVPHQAGIASLTDFTVSVPNEKDTPVTSIRLLIPQGVIQVAPNTVPGWTITTKTNGSSDNPEVSEIDWTDGSIPVGQRTEFVFQAQVPPTLTTLAWKAYQTYSDGTVVSWDVNPESLKNLSDTQQDALADKENKGEYSTTTVINDLTNTTNATQSQSNLPMIFSLVAIALSSVSFGMAVRKTNPTKSP